MISEGQIFVIGDSHIGLTEGSEAPVLEWLDRFAARRPNALYLNGDLFHYLIAHRKFYTPTVEKVFARLREIRDSGVPIYYVEGNRDFFLEGSFVEDAVTGVGLEYAVQAGPVRYLIVHGDMINDRDLPYRFWRFVSKNAASRLSLELIPSGVARRFVDGVERRLAKTNFKHKSRLPIDQLKAYSRKRSGEGYDCVVFGHFHQKTILPSDGATAVILPPWYETGEAMVIDPESGGYSWMTV